MLLKNYKDYDSYYRSQARTHARKKDGVVWVRREEVQEISQYLFRSFTFDTESMKGLCHGVRCGKELELFRECVAVNLEIIGTDILEKDNPDIVKHDFHDVKEEWIGAFDFVYTNSFDHCYDPAKCVKAWLGQLKPNGLLFVEWSKYSMGIRGGDCFSASLHEYMQILDTFGDLQSLLYHSSHRVILVVSPNNAKINNEWKPFVSREKHETKE